MSKEKTALMISIERKKNRLAEINYSLRAVTFEMDVERKILVKQIQEDEKLLEVDREQLIKNWNLAYQHGANDSGRSGQTEFEFKYGTNGE